MKRAEIKKVIDGIEKSLKDKFGEVPIEWMPMIEFYEDYLYLYDELVLEFKNGNRKGVILKSIKDTVQMLLAISQKLGVSSPYDNHRLKQPVKETEEPDYLDTL